QGLKVIRRSIDMDGLKPSVFAALDNKHVVIGFLSVASLQVWDLSSGAKVREFERWAWRCFSLINLPSGQVAAGCYNGVQWVIAIDDVRTGKRLQELRGHDGDIYGLGFVEGHLLSASHSDQDLRVWSMDSSGKVRAALRREAGLCPSVNCPPQFPF